MDTNTKNKHKGIALLILLGLLVIGLLATSGTPNAGNWSAQVKKADTCEKVYDLSHIALSERVKAVNKGLPKRAEGWLGRMREVDVRADELGCPTS